MRIRRLVALSILAAAITVGVAACGGDGGKAAGVPAGTLVLLKDNKFSPKDLSVTAGQTVTWDWKDRFVQHNVVGEGFTSKTQRSGTFTHTFDKAGTYPYRCVLHERMTGTITVTATQ